VPGQTGRGGSGDDRFLTVLEQLLGLEATELEPMLAAALPLVCDALRADKVDCFLYEAAGHSLVALVPGATPMGERQVALGMDRLQLVNGGRAVRVFESGEPFRTGRADRDPEELRGITEAFAIRSELICPLSVGGQRRGVVLAMSRRSDAYAPRDLRFLAIVSRWIGLVMQRAELLERRTGKDPDQGREAASEGPLGLLTPRQREVAALIAAGLTNEQISERLVLTKGAVANHIERIMRRLGARRRAQIAAWIAEQGLHRPDLHEGCGE
jgi:DNA-binding CsgD family transcriptional regulator